MGRSAILIAVCLLVSLSGAAQIIDYHQHLYSPEVGARPTPGAKGITARDLIAQMGAAGISRAVVLSVAYSLDRNCAVCSALRTRTT